MAEEQNTERPEDAFDRNLRRIKTEGLDAATNAAITLLHDPKSPAQARSATINAVFRASGLFATPEEEGELQPSEMTAGQLQRQISKLEAALSDGVKGKSDDSASGEGPFG